MIAAIGWYCLSYAGLQWVVLIYTTFDDAPKTEEWRNRRQQLWISHPIFLAVAVLCFK